MNSYLEVGIASRHRTGWAAVWLQSRKPHRTRPLVADGGRVALVRKWQIPVADRLAAGPETPHAGSSGLPLHQGVQECHLGSRRTRLQGDYWDLVIRDLAIQFMNFSLA